MKPLLALPILIPLITAATSLLFWKFPKIQRWLGVLGSVGLLITGLLLLRWVHQEGIQAIQIGNWPFPFGITLVSDLFSAIMVVLAGIMGFAVTLYSLATIDSKREAFGYYPLFHVLLMGVCGAFLTGDIFNMYVWFEVMLMASFVLLALGGERAQMEGAIKYVTLNLISSALFLAAVGIMYGMFGSVNMADLSSKLAQPQEPVIVTILALLFLVAFGIKAAVFPLFFWLPASYHTPPVAVSAIFAGLLTKVGVYALIRVFSLLFIHDSGFTHSLILIVAALTMVTGVLGAAAQHEFRRILSFHIVSQIGYMIMGLGLFTAAALAGSIFYIIHHIIVKTNLFLVSGVTHRLQGSYELKKLGGLYRYFPFVGILFLIPALSLAGVPPFSGFFAKLLLVQAGLGIEQYWIVGVALAVSLLTLFSMTKIWAEVFWKAHPSGVSEAGMKAVSRGGWKKIRVMAIPIVLLASLTIGIGLAGEPVVALAKQTGEQLMNPQLYITAVVGKNS